MLKLGLPSKGRIQAMTFDWFAARDVRIVQTGNAREYAAAITGLPGVQPVLLSAGEIPRELAAGRLHFGVTGQDLMQELTPDWTGVVSPVAELGFAHADLVIAAPAAWIDVETVADLDDVAMELRLRLGRGLRVATKYARLTRAFLGARGIADYRIVYSQGATEGVVKNGLADVIVDITSSGETLRANHLRILRDGVILKSQSALFRSVVAARTDKMRADEAEFLSALALDAQTTQNP